MYIVCTLFVISVMLTMDIVRLHSEDHLRVLFSSMTALWSCFKLLDRNLTFQVLDKTYFKLTTESWLFKSVLTVSYWQQNLEFSSPFEKKKKDFKLTTESWHFHVLWILTMDVLNYIFATQNCRRHSETIDSQWFHGTRKVENRCNKESTLPFSSIIYQIARVYTRFRIWSSIIVKALDLRRFLPSFTYLKKKVFPNRRYKHCSGSETNWEKWTRTCQCLQWTNVSLFCFPSVLLFIIVNVYVVWFSTAFCLYFCFLWLQTSESRGIWCWFATLLYPSSCAVECWGEMP